jgi:antitoxin component YwqK of YwqJK toxin-antitoxin module
MAFLKFSKKIIYLIWVLITPLLALGQKDSTWQVKYYYEGGQVSSEGTLRNGIPDGYWVSYHRNGEKKTEGNRVNNQLDGLWKFYDEAGTLMVSIEYEAGRKNGLRTTLENGVRSKEEPFADDSREGMVRFFFPEGGIQKEIPYERDREHGLGYEYETDGRIITLNTYKSGVQVKQQRINRKDEMDLKQGYWMYFHPNRQVKEEGLFVNNLKHGYWKYYLPNGNLIRTEKWIMGVLQEDAREVAKVDVRRTINPRTGKLASIGSYVDGKKDGVHRQYDDLGNVIASQLYRQDRLLAEGIFDEQGRKQELWKYFFEDGSIKETGRYKDNLKIGAWKYQFADGSLEQSGSYTAGRPNGLWTWYYPDGNIRKEETYINGEPDGESIEYDLSGEVIAKGEFVDGFKEGKWLYVYGDIREEVDYFEGEFNGKVIRRDRTTNQLLFEGTYASGEENGRFVWYYPNGNVMRRGNYAMGKREGIWESFTEFGVLDFTIEYKNGEEIKYNGKRITYGKRVDRALAEERQGD